MSDGMLVRREADRVIFPGFCDVHVHFREPGFSYKETMITGARAAARGGYTDVCPMPNLNPVRGLRSIWRRRKADPRRGESAGSIPTGP